MSAPAAGLLAAQLGGAAQPDVERQARAQRRGARRRGADGGATRVDRREPFDGQRVILETGLVFDIPPAALEALRRIGYRARRPPAASCSANGCRGRHRGRAGRCAASAFAPLLVAGHLGHERRPACATSDDDGRLESVAIFRLRLSGRRAAHSSRSRRSPTIMSRAARTGAGGTFRMTALGFGWNRDRDSGRLSFFALAVGRRLPRRDRPGGRRSTRRAAGDDRDRRRAAHRACLGTAAGRPSGSTGRSRPGRCAVCSQGPGGGDSAVALSIDRRHRPSIGCSRVTRPGCRARPPPRRPDRRRRHAARHGLESGSVSTATAFAVATLGIASFSGMDAVMKHLALALGAYNAMLWRMLVGRR